MTIHKLHKGDVMALEELYDDLHKRLYLFLVRISNSHEVAEDIIQSTFIKVWENRNKISKEKPLEAQVFVIARNLLLNYIKRKKIELRVIENIIGLDSDVLDGMQEVIYNEARKIYENVINQLPKKRKEIYKLRYLQGYSNKEIADKLQISTNTVENHLSKANGFIRSNLHFLKESTAVIVLLLSLFRF